MRDVRKEERRGEESKEHFNEILNRITYGEVLFFLDDMTNHHNMRIRIAPENRSEIIFAINAVKWSKATGFDGLPVELSAQLLQSLQS